MDEFWDAVFKSLPALLTTLAGFLVYEVKQIDKKRDRQDAQNKELLRQIKTNTNGISTGLQCILDRYHNEAMNQGFITTRQLRHFSDVYEIYKLYGEDPITEHYLSDLQKLPIREDNEEENNHEGN